MIAARNTSDPAGCCASVSLLGLLCSRVLPDIPTLDEAGLRGFDITGWYGLFAPAGTPRRVVSYLQENVAAVVNESRRRARLLLMPGACSPVGGKFHLEQFAAFIKLKFLKDSENRTKPPASRSPEPARPDLNPSTGESYHLAPAAQKEPPHFVYFPGNYRWSAGFINMLSPAAPGRRRRERSRPDSRCSAGKQAPVDDDGWFEACAQVADGVRRYAEKFEQGGHRYAAAHAYLRACNYYQTGELSHARKTTTARSLSTHTRVIACASTVM